MTKPNPAGEQPNAPQPGAEPVAAAQPPTVTGVVSDRPGQQGNVPAGTEPTTAAGAGAPAEEEDSVEVVLAHHWTNPQTGMSYGPRDTAWVSPDTANTLRGAKYLLSPEGVAALRAEQDQQQAAGEALPEGGTPGQQA